MKNLRKLEIYEIYEPIKDTKYIFTFVSAYELFEFNKLKREIEKK